MSQLLARIWFVIGLVVFLLVVAPVNVDEALVSRLGCPAVSHDCAFTYIGANVWVRYEVRKVFSELFKETCSPFLSVITLEHVVMGLLNLAKGA